MDIFSCGDLFEQVQMQQVFKDGKSFVDCVPIKDIETIVQIYEAGKHHTGFNLESFVHHYFIEPKDPPAEYTSSEKPIKTHITALWDVLTREPVATNSSLITLPYPYIVPGGRFREIYYWDSYFTMLGLQVSGRVSLIQNMVDNFSFLIDTVGYIPNGNRTYYLGRSQPPFFACMVQLLAEEKGKETLVKYLPQLEKEYSFWMNGKDDLGDACNAAHHAVLLPDGSILNRYWDEKDTPRPESFKEDKELAKHSADKDCMYRHLRAAAESGWDFSSRWFKDGSNFSTIHTADIIPVDLNCLLYNLEQTIAAAYNYTGDANKANTWLQLGSQRKNALQKYCWSNKDHFYFDYDFVTGSQKRLFTLAAVFPLFFLVANEQQAKAVAATLQKKFLFPGGLVTTLETTGQQWDAPNGWAPLQWMAIKGLINYGYHDAAKEIAHRWVAINEKVYSDTGKLMEKYNVVKTSLAAGGGEYNAQDGFGWTNGIYLVIKQIFSS